MGRQPTESITAKAMQAFVIRRKRRNDRERYAVADVVCFAGHLNSWLSVATA